MIVNVDACGCTNACRHCATDGRPPYGGHFRLEELRSLRREWGPLSLLHEASVHPEFPEILGADIVPEVGFLSSNGFGFARQTDCRTVLARLREMGYKTMSLTLHGLQPHHDWFVARKGAFEDIILTTQRAKELGFGIHWNVWLDRDNLMEIPAVVALAHEQTGGSPFISVPNHRVSERLWRYERLRPTVDEIKKCLPRDLVSKGYSPLQEKPTEQFSEGEWLRAWRLDPQAQGFRFSLEPDTWPPEPPYKGVPLYVTQERDVYLDLHSDPRKRLGSLSEGKNAILQRLRELPMPRGMALDPERARLNPSDSSLVHARGFSVRFKAAAFMYNEQISETG